MRLPLLALTFTTSLSLVSCTSVMRPALNLGTPKEVSINRIEVPSTARVNEFFNAKVTLTTQSDSKDFTGAVTISPNEKALTCSLSAFELPAPASTASSPSATRSHNLALRCSAAGDWIVQASQSAGVATASITISP